MQRHNLIIREKIKDNGLSAKQFLDESDYTGCTQKIHILSIDSNDQAYLNGKLIGPNELSRPKLKSKYRNVPIICWFRSRNSNALGSYGGELILYNNGAVEMNSFGSGLPWVSHEIGFLS